ncbi:MAG: terminase family protein [Trueperaceae bacterium]
MRGLQEAAARSTKELTRFPYHPAQRHIFHDSEALGKYRIFPKGRRLGATQGAAWAVIEYMLQGRKVLWGDTINGNIRRYIQRYFLPAFRTLDLTPGTGFVWHKQDATITLPNGAYTDFRSADKPENWEGFGYDVVFLNEAGIILDDPYLWHNAVLPMMLDNPDSTLIAAGTPKLSSMKGVLFKELWDKAVAGADGYHGRRFTTYDNPFLNEEAIRKLQAEISPAERPQEIEGKFINPNELGSFFRREWFTPLDEPPAIIRAVRGWDFAATEPNTSNPDPDWTVGVKLGITTTGTLAILDVVMDRKGPGGVDALLERTAKADGPTVEHVIPIDPGAAGKTAAQHFKDHPLEGYTVHDYPQTRVQGNKATRATPASVAASEERIGYVRAPWNDWFFSLLAAFPNPKVHDDPVDGLSAAYNTLVGGPTVLSPADSLAALAALNRR